MWEVEVLPRANKSLRKLDSPDRRRILEALKRLSSQSEPQKSCKALSGPFSGLWRFRVGDYRIILRFIDNELVILALDVGHRSSIYR